MSGPSYAVRCMVCGKTVPRADTESVRIGDIAGPVCKAHGTVSVWDAKELQEIRALGERVAALRKRLPQDSPLHSATFRLASLLGEIEAGLRTRSEITKEVRARAREEAPI